MSEYETINQLLNKGQRVVDQIAREIVALKYAPDDANLHKTVEALSLLNDVQKSIWEAEPDLIAIPKSRGELHQESKYMQEYRSYILKSSHHEENNDIPNAIKELQNALNMEPPHIMYEVVEKDIERLKNIR
ncbi:MAG: hypothetical protein HN790_09885 [Methylococcales bacterium]|jgi:hypothetical protein|nr:hypothetical protein [Methylococcales bacterium]